MRPKVSGDAFYLSDPEGTVYFRGNRGSFRMQGPMIDRWVEQLVPMFSGEHTLSELTEGLPESHRNRVFEIASTLYENGFVRDVSRDRPHRLEKHLLSKYASQIEFLDAFGGSGAARFEDWRQSRVIAAGEGLFLASLVFALLESGLPNFRILSNDSSETVRGRIRELHDYARQTDSEVGPGNIEAMPESPEGWERAIESADAVLYVSAGEDKRAFMKLHEACLRRGVPLLPALQIGQTGAAGPHVRSRAEGCWESALRRLHRQAVERDPSSHFMSPAAEGLLANVLVFELFKLRTGVEAPDLRGAIYLLNLETLESARHSFVPHPDAGSAGRRTPVPLSEAEAEALLGAVSPPEEAVGLAALMERVSRLVSPVTGIFQEWEEGELKQLPLPLCRVRPSDPLSAGPAAALRELTCGGFTHEDARREAALSGIEAYAERALGIRDMAVGAGFSAAEGVGRAIHHRLNERLGRRIRTEAPAELAPCTGAVDEERTEFYFRSLTIMRGEPEIAGGPEVLGFPVRWVCSAGRWYGAAGLTPALALRESLALAVMETQLGVNGHGSGAEDAAPLLRAALEADEIERSLPAVRQRLKERGLRLAVYDAAAEPFMKEAFAGVYGVILGEEDAS